MIKKEVLAEWLQGRMDEAQAQMAGYGIDRIGLSYVHGTLRYVLDSLDEIEMLSNLKVGSKEVGRKLRIGNEF